MLFAKINPSAVIVSQSGPFDFDTQNPNILTAVADRYYLNSDVVNFNVMYGFFSNPASEDLPAEPAFLLVYSHQMQMTANELSGWGEDDSFVLDAVCLKLGVEILEIYDRPDISITK